MTQGNGLSELHTSILMTLTYADLSDLPLTLEELHAGLFTPREVPLTELAAALHEDPLLRALVRKKDGYYLLEGRQHLVAVRLGREALHAVLLSRAAPLLALLRNLPTTEAVLLAGAGASGAPSTATVDLLVVSAPGFQWTTSAAAKGLRRLFGLGRCVRLRDVLAGDRLALPENDVFTAHLIATLFSPFPGADAGPVRAANAWVREFFANAYAASGPLTLPSPGGRGNMDSGGAGGGEPARASWLATLLAGFAAPVERVFEGLFGMEPGRSPGDSSMIRMQGFDRSWRRQLRKAEAMARYVAGGDHAERPVAA